VIIKLGLDVHARDAPQRMLPDWLRLLVAEWQAVALDFDTRERAWRAQLEAAAPRICRAASVP
jgi:hypothetical protein